MQEPSKIASKNQKGATAILLVVLMLAVLLVIGLGIAFLLSNQIKTMRITSFSVEAFYAADAGAEKCLYDVRQKTGQGCNVDDVENSGIETKTLDNQSSYEVDKYTEDRDLNGKPEHYIESLGQYQTTSRKVELSWEQ